MYIYQQNPYLFDNDQVDRLEELNKASEGETVSDFKERAQRLTEFERAKYTDKLGKPDVKQNIQAIIEHNRMAQLTDKQPININYQAILDRAKEIEKDFIEGKYNDSKQRGSQELRKGSQISGEAECLTEGADD